MRAHCMVCPNPVVPGRARCYAHGPRNAARRGPNPYGWAWQKLRAQMIGPDTRCSRCGGLGTPTNPMSLDHIIPRSLGGTDHPSNLRPLHMRENISKGGRNRVRHD